MSRSVCTADDCDRLVLGRQPYCDMHYQRWRKYGDPSVVKVRRSRKRWTERELEELEDLLSQGLSDATIGRRLGCSAVSVNLARKRHGIRSRTALIMTAREVARQLGLGCAKTVTAWFERGWLSARRGQQRGSRGRQWYITADALLAFMERPAHWVAWDPARITEPGLRAWALELRAGVRFLTPGQVAERCYVGVGAVNDWIHKGLLPAVKYGNWSIRESDLVGFVPPNQRSKVGCRNRFYTLTEDQRLLALRVEGLSWPAIAAALGRTTGSVYARYERLATVTPDASYRSLSLTILARQGARIQWESLAITAAPPAWRDVRVLRKAAA